MKILMLIIIFFLIGVFFILSENNLHISNKTELKQFNEKYKSWLSDLGGNLKQASGFVIRLDWMPE